MRTAFANVLLENATKNKNIMLLTGDLGYSVFEPFINTFPRQFVNAGISEQNMTGMAAGMAIEGKIPFIYSIIPFVTMRNFEQIRNDICYQNLNVKIVGVGVGFYYGPYGHTHHGLEDVGILRTIPNIIIFSPGNFAEAKFVTEEAIKIKGPVYIRLGRDEDKVKLNYSGKLQFGKGVKIMEGNDVLIITTGTMFKTSIDVAKLLKESGISVSLVSLHTLKPIDEDLIISEAKKVKTIFTIEEHTIIGGLGSIVSDILTQNDIGVKFRKIGVPDRFTKVIGNQEYMRRANGLSAEQIFKYILSEK
jgi:transketolase